MILCSGINFGYQISPQEWHCASVGSSPFSAPLSLKLFSTELQSVLFNAEEHV